MNRSRSFNRFHRYLARQKRHGLKAVLPQSSQLGSIINRVLIDAEVTLIALATKTS
jgi:hypothetical protein